MISSKPRGRRWETILKWISLALVALFMVWIAAYLSVTKYSIYHPKPFDQDRFDQIVAQIQSGKLKANGPIVVLPPDLAGASVTGRAYITKDMIFIPSWIGRKTYVCGFTSSCDEFVEGYIYSKEPLQTGAIPIDGLLNVPGFSNPSKAARDDVAQNIDIFIYSPVGAHWYTADSLS